MRSPPMFSFLSVRLARSLADSMFLSIFISWSFFLGSAASALCNGNAALCGRKYSDLTFIGTHDSAFVGYLPTQNQGVSVADQLGSGIRFLQAQSHIDNGVIKLCHTSCIEEDAGPLVNYLTTVKSFLDANPNEVVTLLLTNGDGRPVSDFGGIVSSTGLDKYAYTPPKQLAMGDWPTLQDLITAGTRFIMFMGKFLGLTNAFHTHTPRLWRQLPVRSIHSRRIRLLLRDRIRCNGFQVQFLRSRSSTWKLRRGIDDDSQPLPRCRHLRHQDPRSAQDATN